MNVTFYPYRPGFWPSPAELAIAAVETMNGNHCDPRKKWRTYRVFLRCAKGGLR